MKNVILLLILFIASHAGWCKSNRNSDNEISLMTFNIRMATDADKENAWTYRKDRAANAVKFYKADIVGMQEVKPCQLEDLKERLPGYCCVSESRTGDDAPNGEHCTIWYKDSRFELLDSGTFWLSGTPDVPGSKGWDSHLPRIATWAKLKDKTTGKRLFFINTHLDHRGKIARSEGARLLLEKIDKLAKGMPVVLSGDFNTRPEAEPYRVITDESNPKCLIDARTVSPLVYGPAWSWHNFGRLPVDKRFFIDYLFVKGPVKVNRYGVLAEQEGEAFISDHAPVLIGVSL